MNRSFRPLHLLALCLVLGSACTRPAPQQSVLRPGTDAVLLLEDGTAFELAWIEPLQMWFGKYEITIDQYRLLRTRLKTIHEPRTQEPKYEAVTMVNHANAVKFCKILTDAFTGFLPPNCVVRLPYDAEWQCCARCGDQRRYPWGNEWPPTAMADGVLPNLLGTERPDWMKKNPDEIIPGYGDGWPEQGDVRKSGRNRWGLYGMAGNVSEWCADPFDRNRSMGKYQGGSWRDYRGAHLAIASASDHPKIPSAFGCGYEGADGNLATGFRIAVGPDHPASANPIQSNEISLPASD